MNVKQIVADYLKAHGYDGLCYCEGECGCGLDQPAGIMPCDSPCDGCEPAYRTERDGETWFAPEKPAKEAP